MLKLQKIELLTELICKLDLLFDKLNMHELCCMNVIFHIVIIEN